MSIWSPLTPESVLNTVEAKTGISLRSLCLPRNSYINRVFELETQDNSRLIVKFYRPDRWTSDMIQEEHHLLLTCHQNELPVIPPLLFNGQSLLMMDNIPFAVFPKKGGRAIDELSPEHWEETGRLLGRLHALANTLDTPNRLRWQPSIATKTHLDTIQAYAVVPPDYEAPLQNAITQFIASADPLFADIPMQLIHGDCHFGNLIYRPGEHLYLVDFDDICVGPTVQDLWMLLPDSVENCRVELASFLSGYRTFYDFDDRHLSLIPALKLMRQIHFAAWCARQSQEAHFQHHFPEWGSTRYWNLLIKDLFSLEGHTH